MSKEALSEDLVGKNEPAYPVSDCSAYQYAGLSKRELFAAMAMQGLAPQYCQSGDFIHVAKGAVLLADALLQELARG